MSPNMGHGLILLQAHHQHCEPGGDQEWRPWQTEPRLPTLAIGTWNVTSSEYDVRTGPVASTNQVVFC